MYVYVCMRACMCLNESPYEKVGKFRGFPAPFNLTCLNESPYEKVGKYVSTAGWVSLCERLNESPYEKVGKSADSCSVGYVSSRPQ